MKRSLTLYLMSLFLLACTTDSYEKGEGEYSLLQADFVEAHADDDMKVDYVDTDDDERLVIAEPFAKSWIKKGDEKYRGILYYKKKDAKRVDVVSFTDVKVLSPIPVDTLEKKLKLQMKTDPVSLESVWLSKTKRYLNVGFYLKVGVTDDQEAVHKMSVVADSVHQFADGKKTLYLRLFHDQGDVPEYYSQRSFFSLALNDIGVDSLQLSVNTYDGVVKKSFSVK